MIITSGYRRPPYETSTSNSPLILTREESTMDFKSNGSTTGYDAFSTTGMMNNTNNNNNNMSTTTSSNPNFNYVSSFNNFIPQPSSTTLMTATTTVVDHHPHPHSTTYPQDQHNVSSIELRSSPYVVVPPPLPPMTSGSTIVTTTSTSTDYFKPPADINDKIVKDEIIVDSQNNKSHQHPHAPHQQQQQHHQHHQSSGMSWNDSRPGQDPIVNMMMMGGGLSNNSTTTSGNSGGYPDDSLVAHYTYYSPSPAIQSSPSSDFSPPPNSFMTSNGHPSNNSNNGSHQNNHNATTTTHHNNNNTNHVGMASFGRPQPYIKRRRSSALAITTPMHDTVASTIVDNDNTSNNNNNNNNKLESLVVHPTTAAVAPAANATSITTSMPGHYYSPIPSQPSLENIQAHHSSSQLQQQHQQQHYVATSGSTSTMVTPTSSATGTPSPCSFPGSASSSSSAGQPIIDQRNATTIPLLRFNIILQASTAATQISEGSPTTYLNRGQSYAIHLQDTYDHDVNITSTFIIMFHEPSHRKVALNYWKFWLGQQKNPPDARAVTLDQEQSVGIHNIRFPSFDRITFDWNGRYGAKIFVRFNCLSTDFSRIKGVKGIPLRAQMETKTAATPSSSSSSSQQQQQQLLANNNTFPPSSSSSSSNNSNNSEFIEQCYCKIKLFRDKGAERKNKDDAKQIGKHLERVYAEGNPRQHPFWLMYNQPKPYSVFSEIPTTPQASSDTLFSNIMDDPQQPQSQQQPSQIQLFSQQKMEKTSKMNDMTPSPTSNGNNISNHGGLGAASLLNQPFIGQQQQPHTNHQHHPLQHKRSYSQMDEHPSTRIFDLTATVSVSSLSLSENRPASCHLTATPTNTTTGLSLYVNVKTTQHQRFHSPPSPTTPGTTSGTTSSSNPAATSRSRADKKKLQYIVLDHITVQELIIKLCPVLSLHYSQVSEVLWRQPKSTATPVVSNSNNNNTWDNNTSRHCHSITTTSSSTSTTKASLSNHRTNGNDGTLVRVDDKILASSFTNDSVVGVEWEIKSDGTVRLLLQQ